MPTILTGALPYACAPLTVSQAAALLPADVLARALRQSGERVVYVSGSDCHGTLISLKAKREGVSPAQCAQQYHKRIARDFAALGFSFDEFLPTTAPAHREFVRQYLSGLERRGAIYRKDALRVTCLSCATPSADLPLTGQCPLSRAEARTDAAVSPSPMLDALRLQTHVCALCAPIRLGGSRPAFLRMGGLTGALRAYLSSHTEWSDTVRDVTAFNLEQGIGDYAITREADWGLPALQGGDKVYVWVEALLSYLTAVSQVCARQGEDFPSLWNRSTLRMVHFRDNIPFHTLLLPALLLGGQFKPPDWFYAAEPLACPYTVEEALQRVSSNALRLALCLCDPTRPVALDGRALDNTARQWAELKRRLAQPAAEGRPPWETVRGLLLKGRGDLALREALRYVHARGNAPDARALLAPFLPQLDTGEARR